MSEWLLDALHESLSALGLTARKSPEGIQVADLWLGPRVEIRDASNGAVHAQVEFDVRSPRLAGVPFTDSFAGIGISREAAERDALGKFLQGSLHVITHALLDHGDSQQVDCEDWRGDLGSWRICSGPVLVTATRPGSRIEGFGEGFERLADWFRREMAAGPHWMRVFVGSVEGELKACDVVIDGAERADAESLLQSGDWAYPPGYASLRHLLITLPR